MGEKDEASRLVVVGSGLVQLHAVQFCSTARWAVTEKRSVRKLLPGGGHGGRRQASCQSGAAKRV